MDPPADSRAKSAMPVLSAAKSFSSSRTTDLICESSTTGWATDSDADAVEMAAEAEWEAISLHDGG